MPKRLTDDDLMQSVPLLDRTKQNFFLLLLLALYVSVGATVIGDAHGHRGIAVGSLYFVVFGCLLGWVFFSSHGAGFFAILRTSKWWVALLLISAPVIQTHYTKNQLKPNPLSSSIALEAPARAFLLHGKEMYSVTANCAPISPGPGWILLWSPITVFKWTGLLGVLALGILLLLLSRRNPLWGGLFAPLMLVEPHFLSHVLNGQDLYVISLALVAITLLLMEVKDHVGHVLLLGLLGGVIATSRIPIVGMLVVLGFDLWRRNRRSGAIFLVSMCSVTLLLHGIFFIWAMHNGDVYQPTHYLSRPSYQLVKPVMVLLALAALLWIYRSKPSTSNWLLGIFLVMAALFTPEGIAEFLPVNNPGWEALNYVCFPIPVLLAAIVCRTHQESGAQIISHQMEESAV